MADTQPIPDLEPLLTAQQNHLASLTAESTSTDAKALGIAAANVAILIFIAQAHLDFSSWLIHSALLVPYCVSLLFNLFAILPYSYIGAGVNLISSPDYLNMDRPSLIAQLLTNTQVAITHNNKLNRRRWQYCAISLMFTAIGTAVLFAILGSV
jgi:hypothetical protein